MKKVRMVARFTFGSGSLALLLSLTAGHLRAQEIRAIAEPNQAIRMGRGGYVCDGQLTHTPIDATENWTYEMVQCTGPIYDSRDYAALYSKFSYDAFVNMKVALQQENASRRATQGALNNQAQTINTDLRAIIDERFQELPQDVLLSAAVQNLKKSLIEYVDQKFPRTPPSNPPAREGPAPPPPARERPATPPNQR
ncbi:MAG: hypothetical protein ACLQVG_26990 [Terriglobia bacterium]